MVLPFLCSFVVALVARPVGVASEYKGTEFVLPDKWTKEEADGVLILNPPTTQEGEVLVVMIVPAVESGIKKKARDRFLDFLAGADSKTNVISKSAITPTTRGDLQVFVLTEQLNDKQEGDYSCLYQMVTDEKNDAFAGVISKGEKLIEKYQKSVSDILVSVRPRGAAAARTTIRTGNTPDIYPGMPGWLPSGNGRMIPTAKLVDGKPNGMWFEGSMYLKSLTLAQSKISTTIFFADGTMIEHPRFGSGGLVDIEGQKAKPGNAKLVGTWTISGGKMTYEIRGFHHIDSYVTGKDTSGVYFEINRTRYLPCEPVSEAFLQGTWTMPSSASRTFGPNCGLKISGSNASATYALDGYLLAIDNGSQYIVDSIFKLTNDAIVIGASVYHRQKG